MPNPMDISPILEAIRANDFARLRSLLPPANTSLPSEILTAAEDDRKIEILDLVLPYYPTSSLYDIVSLAIQHRDMPALKHIVENYNAAIYPDDGRISYVIEKLDKELFRYLTTRGFNVNEYYTSHFGGCLDKAIRQGDEDFLRFLLEEMKCDPNIGEFFVGHNTPLATAVKYQQIGMMKMLFEYGATMECCDALQAAAYMGRKDMVELLLEKGADVNQVIEEASDEAPLMAAVRSLGTDRLSIIEMLLEKGADVTVKQASGTFQGKTALDVARDLCFSKAEELLESYELSNRG